MVYFRYDPDLARFEDPPSVTKPNDEIAFKFCPSCVRIQQKQLVTCLLMIFNLLLYACLLYDILSTSVDIHFYVALAATYIRLLHGKIGFLGFFSALAP